MSDAHPKRLLVIAHEFPPVGGSSVMRALKFAKYLPAHGWHPVILTVYPEDCYGNRGWGLDTSLLAQIEDRASVHRIPSPLEGRLRRLTQKLGSSGGLDVTPAGARKSFRWSRVWDLPILRSFLTRHDVAGLWLPYAYRYALKLVREEKVDAILTTSPPHLTHLVGYWLKRRTRLPWVTDFRDGWTDNFVFGGPSPLRRRLNRRLERNIVTLADANFVVTQYLLAAFQRAYPAQAEGFHLLRNGFDPDDFAIAYPATSPDVVTFLHVGSLWLWRDPVPLLEAFRQLFAEGRLNPEKVRVQLIGPLSYDREAWPLADVEVIPPVEHAEAIRRMVGAGVLLLITSMQEGEGAFTSKVSEYLAAKRPILALTPPSGELAELLGSWPLATTASPADVGQIKAGILRAYQMALDGPIIDPLPGDVLREYDRRVQVRQLANILDELSA